MAASPSNVKVGLEWMDPEIFERDDAVARLEHVHGILVPGGFGERGTEGKIHAVKFARERDVPFFGICFGMQMAVIEAARNLLGIEDASSSEFGPCDHAVVGLMTEWTKGNRDREARGRWRSWRHHAARRLSGASAAWHQGA